MQDKKRLKILFLPAWYPSPINPIAGIFVREHARAASLYNDIVVLYTYPDPLSKTWTLYQASQVESVEHGIRTIRVSYGGSLLYLKRWLIRKLLRVSAGENVGGEGASKPKFEALLRLLFGIPSAIINELFYYWSIFAAFRKLKGEGWRPDIIHAHVYSAGVPAVLVGKRYGLPVVITEHWSGFPLGLVRGVEKMLAKFAFERADLVCPVSEDLRRHIASYGIRARFCVVPNVVDTSLFTPGDKVPTAEDNRKRLLLVAVLRALKGVPCLLEALTILREKCDDFVLDIVGDGPNRSEYEKLARKLGLRDVVHFHGLKTKREVAEFMRKADIFVLPSEWENLPCVIIEAMASGLPIVATSVGGIPEIVSSEAGMLVPPRDALTLARALYDVLEHLDQYKGENIALQAKQRFSYEVVGKVLSNLYEDLVSTTKGRRKV